MVRGQERIYCAKLRISCVLQHTIPSHSCVIVIGGILKQSRRVVKTTKNAHDGRIKRQIIQYSIAVKSIKCCPPCFAIPITPIL